MTAVILKTKAEQHLEQLEALRRPLTYQEGQELRRCLHAIYMRHWRLEQSIIGRVDGELLDIQRAARIEANAIAERMEEAADERWPKLNSDRWQDDARQASADLLQAIEKATVPA